MAKDKKKEIESADMYFENFNLIPSSLKLRIMHYCTKCTIITEDGEHRVVKNRHGLTTHQLEL